MVCKQKCCKRAKDYFTCIANKPDYFFQLQFLDVFDYGYKCVLTFFNQRKKERNKERVIDK